MKNSKGKVLKNPINGYSNLKLICPSCNQELLVLQEPLSCICGWSSNNEKVQNQAQPFQELDVPQSICMLGLL